MPARPARHDRYGRPLPTLTTASAPQLEEESPASLRQRHRLRKLLMTLEERFPELLRAGVSADVRITLKVVGGTIQAHGLSVDIKLRYRPEED